LGDDKKNGELVVGGYNKGRVNDLVYFHAFDYNGFWEMTWNSVDYGAASRHLKNQKGIIMLHLPFILFPSGDIYSLIYN